MSRYQQARICFTKRSIVCVEDCAIAIPACQKRLQQSYKTCPQSLGINGVMSEGMSPAALMMQHIYGNHGSIMGAVCESVIGYTLRV
jgi:hypothetical protein